jgi:hypothetical protein
MNLMTSIEKLNIKGKIAEENTQAEISNLWVIALDFQEEGKKIFEEITENSPKLQKILQNWYKQNKLKGHGILITPREITHTQNNTEMPCY